MTAASCADCGRDVEHCHGVLLVHADGTTECDVDGCEGVEEGHEHVASCDDRCCARTG